MLYLGFDCSTQSLSAIIIEITPNTRRIVFEQSIDFDDGFPSYRTSNGVRRDPADPSVVFSSPLMWAEALDRTMERIAREPGLDTSEIRAISGSAQQHGSVYLNANASTVFPAIDPQQSLVDQVRGCLARQEAPVWMDTSTSAECAAIESALGGAQALARLTGSRAFERFTGPQVRKFATTDPERYARTERISLVSSYMASLLAGCHAPTEPGDAAGMNLMDISTRTWSEAALDATAPDLRRRLPRIESPWSVVGTLAPYWRRRYGFPAASVVVWTGDNPSSLIGTGIVKEGGVAVSLGTSDTLFGAMREARIDPSGAAHVFGSPTGEFMGLICFRNGALARERIRQAFGLTWEEFSTMLGSTPPGNHGAVMLPWFEPEITPAVRVPGVRRYALDPGDAAANVRGVVEAQMLAMSRHSRWMGVRIETIHATGGAAVNREILQILADVFDAVVYQMPAANAACLGAALRAYHADRRAVGTPISWEEAIVGFAEPVPESRIRPVPAHVRAYAEVAPRHAEYEERALQNRG